MNVKITRIQYLLVLLVCVIVSQTASAQYSWQVVLGGQVVEKRYSFSDASCFGSYCTVVGYIDSADTRLHRIWNSDDWGKTWSVIDPQLPDSLIGRRLLNVFRVDELNIFITADSGLAVRSTDGGSSWFTGFVPGSSLHFSDLMTGICLGFVEHQGQYYSTAFITSDGGNAWQEVAIDSTVNFTTCQSLGQGGFRIYGFENSSAFSEGKIYSTENNWQTVDSVGMFDTNPEGYLFNHAAFSRDDITIAYGYHYKNASFNGILIRSTTNGATWEPVFAPHEHFDDGSDIGWLHTMTSPDSDTIIAAGETDRNKILISFDRGATWHIDTLPVPKRYIAITVNKMLMMDNGNVLGIYVDHMSSPDPKTLFLGERTPSSVKTHDTEDRPIAIYPNPAIESINIHIPSDARSLQIIDALGRAVRIFPKVAAGTMKFDVSSLDPGVYHIVIGSDAGARSSAFIVAE